MLDEVEERRLTPVEVVEHADEWSLPCDRLELLAECPGDLLARGDELLIAEQRLDRLGCGRIDVGRGELLENLHHRPVRDPLAVRKAASSHDQDVVERGKELRRQPGLADAGRSEDGEELTRALRRRPLPHARQLAQLPRAADHRPGGVPSESLRSVDRLQAVGNNRLGLALQQPRLEHVYGCCVTRQPVRLLADQDLARLRRLLQARSNIDRVAGRKTLLRAGHDLAGRHPDPPSNPELGERLSHLDRSPERAQRVILVQHRHPEHRHHRIADELLDRAAVILDDRLHPLEVARQHQPQRLGIELLTKRRRAGDVTEEHRHRLPLLLNEARLRERSGTRVTEPGTVTVGRATAWAIHRLSLGNPYRGCARSARPAVIVPGER